MMTDTTDTSAEAVERPARVHEGAVVTVSEMTAATLRALLARAEKADAERDRLRAERDEAREVLRGALAAMQAIHPDARGDMTDARIASLWNAALAAAEALLKEAGHD